VTIDEARRPYLLHLRMIQEWLLCGRREVLPSDIVVAETEFGELPDAGSSERYSRADHTHGSPALGGDVAGTAGDLVVERLRGIEVVYDEGTPQPGQVLTFVPSDESPVEAEADGTWRPRDPEVAGGPVNLAGDVNGPAGDNQIDNLQKKPVQAPEPAEGQVLTFSDGAWRANDPAPGLTDLRGDVVGPSTDNRIENLQAIPVKAPEPTESQVLTFSEGAWRAHDPVAGATNLAGDVTGPTDNTLIENLQKIPVKAPEPNEGQVLTFSDGAWRANDPTSGLTDLRGDVVGRADDNQVENLQGIQVRAREPQNRQVLTFVDDEGGARWIPANVARATGDAVLHPPGLPTYQIVAAGLVALDGVRSPLTYNGLVARVIDDSRVLVAFDRYEPPNLDRFTYVVKALPEFSLEIRRSLVQQMDTGGMPTVAFEDFTVDIRDDVFPNGGFILFVCIGDRLIKRNILGRLQLMIEVSRYEVAG
jgi:hypothetical protein